MRHMNLSETNPVPSARWLDSVSIAKTHDLSLFWFFWFAGPQNNEIKRKQILEPC